MRIVLAEIAVRVEGLGLPHKAKVALLPVLSCFIFEDFSDRREKGKNFYLGLNSSSAEDWASGSQLVPLTFGNSRNIFFGHNLGGGVLLLASSD